MRLLLAIAAGLLLASPVAAQEYVARAEDGSVIYSLGAPAGLEQPVEVERRAVAWTETIRPARLVRTTSDGVERVGRRRTPGSPAGTILYGYTLRTGLAYCPTVAPDALEVQCYRDFDQDGTFEGSYVTLSRGIDSMVLPGGLHELVGMPRVSYESAPPEAAPSVQASVVFVGWSRDQPRFRMQVEDEWLDHAISCAPQADGLCAVNGLLLRVADLGGGRARIELVSAAAERALLICFDSQAPGTGCRSR